MLFVTLCLILFILQTHFIWFSALSCSVIPSVVLYCEISVSNISSAYRAFLDLAVQPENIIKTATENADMIKPLVSIKPRFLQKLLGRVVAASMKHSDSNFPFTYLGRLDLPEEVIAAAG